MASRASFFPRWSIGWWFMKFPPSGWGPREDVPIRDWQRRFGASVGQQARERFFTELNRKA